MAGARAGARAGANNSPWTPRYLHIWLFYLAQLALVIGGLTFMGMALLERNLLEDLLGSASVGIYFIIGLAAVYVMFDRNTYLPFLGPTHMSCGALEPRTPTGANRTLTVHVAPRAKVLYWAAEPSTDGLKEIPSWKGAYLGYENTGIALADASGRAVLRVRTPQRYSVPIHGLLEPHVHYRVCEEGGWLGRVMTVPVEGVPSVEPFSGSAMEYRAMWI